MVVYIFLLGVLIFLVSFRLKFKRLGFENRSTYVYPGYWFGVILVILIAGFRDGGGVDYFSYVRIYETLGDYYTSEKIEKGFYYLNSVSKLFDLGAEFVIFVSFFATFLLISLTIKRYSSSYPLSFLIMFSNEIVFLFQNIIRQGLAVAICFYSLKFIVERKFWLFFFTVTIATLFHKSALLFYLAYFFVIRLPRLIVLGVYFLSLYFLYDNSYVIDFIYSVDDFIFSGRYHNLLILLEDHERSLSNKMFLFNLLFILFVLTYKKIWLDEYLNLVLFNLSFIGIIILNLVSGYLVLNRFTVFFTIFFALSIPVFLGFYFKAGWFRIAFYLIVYLTFTLIFVRVLIFDGNSIFPYNSLLF
ncbi:EpsG family protein [Galenea microaerophila]